ncbi:hypothetical protein B566_EDAN010261 [Ephemera danica]|nr:hypothetical protein B566_EDAN010261 [Ephemera danica]
MELIYIESSEEISCLKTYANSTDELKILTETYWTSGACTDCPKRYFWCTGPGEEVNDGLWQDKDQIDDYETFIGFEINSNTTGDDDEDYDEEENEDENDDEEEEEEEDDEEEEEEESEDEDSETNGQIFEAWTSGISSEKCPRSFRWCSGTSNLPVSQAVKSDSEEPPTKVLELCLIVGTSKVDKNADKMKITLKSKKCSDRKVKALCKKPFRKSPATVAPNMNFANKLHTTIRPAPTFQIKITGPINMLPNIKMCVPVCAPLKPKDFSLFTMNGALKTPLNHGTLSTACNKDYMLSKNSMACSAALQFCGSLGMTLLVVDSVRDLDCLKNAMPVLGNTDVWTAAADISCSRRFQWCGSNMAVVDALWASDQLPYSDQHRCARLSKSRLRRENCNVPLKVLCQSAARTINKL